jgi:hypothetical protein
MKTLTHFVGIVGVLLLPGCSGQLYTVQNPLPDPNDPQKKIEGVIAYQLVDVVEVSYYSVLVDEKTKEIVGTAKNGKCEPKRIYKVGTRADFSKPYALNYDAGILETHTFGVELTSGVVTKVNSESHPSDALGAVAALLPWAPGIHAAAAAAAAPAVPGMKLCNDGEVLEGIFRAPAIKPSANMPKSGDPVTIQ